MLAWKRAKREENSAEIVHLKLKLKLSLLTANATWPGQRLLGRQLEANYYQRRDGSLEACAPPAAVRSSPS